jgi:hypothetical protein
LREDPRLLDGRRVLEVGDGCERPKRKPPAPAIARRVLLRVADDLGDGEDRLPDRGVEDRELAALHRRPLRGRVRPDRGDVHFRSQRRVAATANEQPAGGRQSRSMTPAIAIPNPMHMHATP